jgi:hypothetical protein
MFIFVNISASFPLDGGEVSVILFSNHPKFEQPKPLHLLPLTYHDNYTIFIKKI